ncbi:MAG: DUF2934 domain-containing protein, partial [Alphaproteobacteria bacterium]|nr:DUF2934 domain-containing protein [Alphaproteobacteria bacterium]
MHNVIEPAEELIARRAYEIWEREGRPNGRDADHWAQARWELMGEAATATLDPAPTDPAPADPAPAEPAPARAHGLAGGRRGPSPESAADSGALSAVLRVPADAPAPAKPA